jgi:hypothetical protein
MTLMDLETTIQVLEHCGENFMVDQRHALEVIKLQSPYVIIEYVTRQKLFRHEDFVWVNEYTSENGKLT